MDFKTIRVSLPKHDADVVIVFPGGKELVLQARPSNADVNCNGSLDIILPKDDLVTTWKGDDMEVSSVPNPGRQHERIAKQLVMELPGDYEEVEIGLSNWARPRKSNSEFFSFLLFSLSFLLSFFFFFLLFSSLLLL